MHVVNVCVWVGVCVLSLARLLPKSQVNVCTSDKVQGGRGQSSSGAAIIDALES